MIFNQFARFNIDAFFNRSAAGVTPDVPTFFAYYHDEFYGFPVSELKFPQLLAWAARAVANATRHSVSEDNFFLLPDTVRAAYVNGICYQISYYAEDGLTTAIEGNSDKSFTVGKVSVQRGSSGSASSRAGSGLLCPAAVAELEQSGLLAPQVDTVELWGVW